MRLVTVMHANDLKDDCIQWFPVCLTPPALGDFVLNTNTQTIMVWHHFAMYLNEFLNLETEICLYGPMQ